MLGIFALFEGRIIIVIAISNRHLVILGKYCCHIGKDIRMLDPKNPGARARCARKEAAKPAPQPAEPERASPTPTKPA